MGGISAIVENTSDVVMCMRVSVCVRSQVRTCWRVLGGAGVWTSFGDFSFPFSRKEKKKSHSVIIAPLNAAVNHCGPLTLKHVHQL